MPLESLLITPVQRLPRYVYAPCPVILIWLYTKKILIGEGSRLLFKELLETTHPSHPDYKNLSSAVVAVGKQASTLNKNIQLSHALKEVILVQEKLVGDGVPVCLSSRLLKFPLSSPWHSHRHDGTIPEHHCTQSILRHRRRVPRNTVGKQAGQGF